jgi:hypothetical protein
MSLTNFLLGARLPLCVAILVVAGGHQPACQILADAPAEVKKSSPTTVELTKLATVIKPSAAANKWQQIPWLTDFNKARNLAKKEKRPLFLWTVFGEPLDEC